MDNFKTNIEYHLHDCNCGIIGGLLFIILQFIPGREKVILGK